MAGTFEIAIIHEGPTLYQFASNFDGLRYYIDLLYNPRNDTWYMTVKDSDLDILLGGLPCLTNVQGMTIRFGLSDVFPLGDLICIDTNNNGADPSFQNFGDSVSCFYTSVS
jgi:hypothetical protein